MLSKITDNMNELAIEVKEILANTGYSSNAVETVDQRSAVGVSN